MPDQRKEREAQTLRAYAEAKAIYEEYQRLKRQLGISRRDIFYFLTGRHWEETRDSLEAVGSKKQHSRYVV